MKEFDEAPDEIYMVVVARPEGDCPKISKAEGDVFHLCLETAWRRCEELNEAFSHLSEKMYTVIAFSGSVTREFESVEDVKAHLDW